ncbi:hypothetical protein [Confluentibacter flavum]|uniref:Uncharacterized protein n=1 Tax=Confluentibacter flavum TaxID=1909700 RepID=A0A2N3HKV9_9FLAO|nr:hypothetical protein [Confluentibacter flavum]PKQ45609.1 hypothetical protein CSW08_07085 [Confluentibacter flavum]
MKKTDTDKEIEQLVEKMMKETSLDTPSFDFTAHIMSKVLEIKTSEATVYKPLISKKVWGIIAFGVLALVIFIVFGAKGEASGIVNPIDFSMLTNNKIINTISGFKASSFQVSKTFSHALMFLGIMICVQILFLKHHFNQRFEN